MQSLAQLESAAVGSTPLRWSGRLETDLRRVGCLSRVSFVWNRSIDSTRSLSPSSLSSRYGPPLLPGFVYPKYRSGRSRILCVQDEVSKPELNDLAEIMSNESGEVDAMTQKGGSNYFSALEKDKNVNEKLSAVTKFDPRRPFDLTWIGAWADEVSERGMHKRRTFYSHDDWLQHRSSTRHYRHFASTLSSRVIVSLIPPVGTMTAISVAISIYNSIVLSGWLPSFIPLLHASPLSYQLTAPALALLLVFRTEASYSRYDEARKTWTKVISSSKDMARQSMTWAQSPDDNRHKKLLLDYILAFSVALKCHLLYNSDFEEELSEILEKDDLALVLNAEHRPNCLIQLITHSLKCIQLEDGERSLLDANISQFNESISICERIIRTPIPLAYTRLTSRILVLWHLALPVVLWDDCQWVVVPATFISAASLFCIEEVGVLIEEPFPILALDRMCSKARENIQEIANLQLQTQEHLRKKTIKVPRNGVANGVIRS